MRDLVFCFFVCLFVCLTKKKTPHHNCHMIMTHGIKFE